jgi:murein DD-endopeptidase MepM/ murein hydrolase activator NlpD
MKPLILFILLLPALVHAQLDNKTIMDLKGGRVKPDNSYIYALPFEAGKKVFLIQAYNSGFSHKGEIALDFKVKTGTKIFAAREGVVTATKEDSDRGGAKNEFMGDGNHIIVQHDDGSIAWYWHLQKDGVLVNEGDTIQKGQWIGLSGNTGYSAFPHLHFEVSKDGKQIPTRFETNKGVKYLRPGKFYRKRKAGL